ncbi:unnamed protein product [Arctogadus glacialis]
MHLPKLLLHNMQEKLLRVLSSRLQQVRLRVRVQRQWLRYKLLPVRTVSKAS